MTEDYIFSEAPENPLEAAVSSRDRDVMKSVAQSIENKSAVIGYQPVVLSRNTRRTAFYEGLVRLLDSNGRVIPARDFIGSIERDQLGRKIDCIALELGIEALHQNPALRLSINMSARSIGYQPWQAILDTGLKSDTTVAERLILEITEPSAMAMPEIVQAFMQDLQGRGLSFALDDFGSSFTSFRHLRDMYFDIVKIDGGFVQGIAHSPDDQIVVKSLVSVGHHLDMLVVAEKVETAEDAEYLSSIGVDCLQGYLFGAPKRRVDFTEMSERLAAG